MKPKFINIYSILELFELESQVKILDKNGNVLYNGILCEIDFNDDDLFWREVEHIIPGICTYIELADSCFDDYKEEWKREYMCKWYMGRES